MRSDFRQRLGGTEVAVHGNREDVYILSSSFYEAKRIESRPSYHHYLLLVSKRT